MSAARKVIPDKTGQFHYIIYILCHALCNWGQYFARDMCHLKHAQCSSCYCVITWSKGYLSRSKFIVMSTRNHLFYWEEEPCPPRKGNISATCRKSSTVCHMRTVSLVFNFYHRITERLRSEGTSGGCLVQPPFSSRATRASCPGSCPDGFWIFPWKETLQLLWTTCSCAQSLDLLFFIIYIWSYDF